MEQKGGTMMIQLGRALKLMDKITNKNVAALYILSSFRHFGNSCQLHMFKTCAKRGLAACPN